MSWEDIAGFSVDIEPFYRWLATRLPQGARFVEVGVLYGRSIACLGTLRPDLDLWAVDSWEEQELHQHHAYVARYGSVWRAFERGMREHAPEVFERLHVLRAQSTAPWGSELTADAVFLDAGHDYPSIAADIAHWRPRVRPGGILSGHDFTGPAAGVEQAVVEAFRSKHQMGPDTDGIYWEHPNGQVMRSTCWWVQL